MAGAPLVMPNWPRVVFDITQHEVIVGVPTLRPIFHSYSDPLPAGSEALCYSLEAPFAEKTRALLERTRSRVRRSGAEKGLAAARD